MGSMRRLVFLIAGSLILLSWAHTGSTGSSSVVQTPPVTENLDVFHRWIRWNNPGSFLINHLIDLADGYHEIRDKEIAALRTREDWENRQELVRGKLMDLMGPFPGKTPLNPQITGTLYKDGYRVEKIVYESMPGLYVTGALFIPEGIDPGGAPAILNFIGHNQIAFRAELYQIIILNLVKKGMIVFAIDPPGQGERVQYYDPEIEFSSIGYSVIEHCYAGNQVFLSGASIAKYFTWDGIRAIDYLLTRSEVDSSRIGVTGFSGGGTVTSFVSALDDRVSVSVPSSWATASKRQLETRGAQDAETELARSVAEGITFEDLLAVRAPKPTLMTFASRDQYLPLQGAREALWEVQRAYEAFGKKDNIRLVVDDYEHWMTPKLRIALYSFFMEHFGLAGDSGEEDIELLNPEDLQVTSTGQVTTSLNSRIIFDINRDETLKLMERLEESRNNNEDHRSTVIRKAMEISGYQPPNDEVIEPFINGRYRREGYTIEKFAVRGEGYYAIPMLIFIPDNRTEKYPAVVYLHSQGKAAQAHPGGEIEELVRKGYIVAAADVSGVGEISNTAARGMAAGYTGVLIGKSIPGIQAADIVRVVNYLKTRPDVYSGNIGAVGIGDMGVPLLHAAAFDSSISNITLIGPLISYRSVAMNRYYRSGLTERAGGGVGHPYEVDFDWGITGVLTGYDLPDLLACIAPRKVVLADIRDHMLEPASQELVKLETAFPARVYSSKNALENLNIVSSFASLGTLVDWCFR